MSDPNDYMPEFIKERVSARPNLLLNGNDPWFRRGEVGILAAVAVAVGCMISMHNSTSIGENHSQTISQKKPPIRQPARPLARGSAIIIQFSSQ